jgi:hypothetical protein
LVKGFSEAVCQLPAARFVVDSRTKPVDGTQVMMTLELLRLIDRVGGAAKAVAAVRKIAKHVVAARPVVL